MEQIIRTIRNDYCILMYTGNDDLRPWTRKVNLTNGFIFASDGVIAAMVNHANFIKKYENVEGFPNVKAVFEQHIPGEKKKFSTDELFTKLMEFEVIMKPRMETCDECDGDKTIECYHCGSKIDCPICEGTGKTETDELELTGENECMLFERKYKLSYLQKIILTAIILDIKEITIINPKNDVGTKFIVGDFLIYLMPLSPKNNDDNE